jgi:hypothetical protein
MNFDKNTEKPITIIYPEKTDITKDPSTVAWHMLDLYDRMRPGRVKLDDSLLGKALFMVADVEPKDGFLSATITTFCVSPLDSLNVLRKLGKKTAGLVQQLREQALKPGKAGFAALLRIKGGAEDGGWAVVLQPLEILTANTNK